MYKLLLTSRIFPSLEEPMALIRRGDITLIDNPYFGKILSEEMLLDVVGEADAAIVGDDSFTRKVIESAASLKVLSKFGVGVDRIDLPAAKDKGIIVTNTPGTNKHAVADMTLGLLISAARRIPQAVAKAHQGDWKVITGAEVWEKTLGIVGLGNIGKEIARRARGFNMKILAYEPYPDADFVKKYGITLLGLEDLMKQSDFISLNLPSIPSTKNLINRNLLEAAKKGAYLINTARADVIDEDALYEVLTSGRLAGAALDVMNQEPAPIDHPLLKLDNVIITPHIAGHTWESQIRMGLMAAENLLRVLDGKDPLHRVV